MEIERLHELLINNKVTPKELIEEAIGKAKKFNEKCNAFVTVLDSPKEYPVIDDLLSGIPYAVKDNYSTKGILTTGSSNTLKDYVPVFNATAIEHLNSDNAIIAAKTVLDEFGMGGTGTTGHTGVVKNPWDLERQAGGSSAGSAACVAAGIYPYALGSDTGDSIRKPAAFCGIVGYKPTYGMISRFGLFPFASSLDTCGVLTRSVKDAAIVVDCMKGKDPKDQTTWDSSNINLTKSLDNNLNGKKLFYIKEIVNMENYPNATDELKEHINNFYNSLEIMRREGATIEEVSIDRTLLNALPSIYVCLSCAEATSNMSNLTGIIFGPKEKKDNVNEMIKEYRTKNFSSLIKRRFVIGSYVLQKENQEKYFVNAQRVRRLITDRMNELFKEYDALVMPVGSGPAPFLDNSKNKSIDNISLLEEHLQIANYGGFPSITIPNGFINGLPVGINFTGPYFKDESVLSLAYSLESKMKYEGQTTNNWEVNND